MPVENTAELREMLLSTIEAVKDKTMDARQANAIANLSGKILQSARIDLEALKFNKSFNGKTELSVESNALRLIKQK